MSWGSILSAGSALLLAAVTASHHFGYSSGFTVGKQTSAAETAQARKNLAEADAKATLLQSSLEQIQKLLDAQAREAEVQRMAAQRAVDAAKQQAAASERSLKTWRAQYDKAVTDPDCAVLAKEQLCPALRSY
jgi:DNA repair exonuclease SbcCD ATPase subunit